MRRPTPVIGDLPVGYRVSRVGRTLPVCTSDEVNSIENVLSAVRRCYRRGKVSAGAATDQTKRPSEASPPVHTAASYNTPPAKHPPLKPAIKAVFAIRHSGDRIGAV